MDLLEILLSRYKSQSHFTLRTFQRTGSILFEHGLFNRCIWMGQASVLTRFKRSTIVGRRALSMCPHQVRDHMWVLWEIFLLRLVCRLVTQESTNLLFGVKNVVRHLRWLVYCSQRIFTCSSLKITGTRSGPQTQDKRKPELKIKNYNFWSVSSNPFFFQLLINIHTIVSQTSYMIECQFLSYGFCWFI